MIGALQFFATFCVALFAGAALYINLVEHPARLSVGTAAAAAHWAPSYQRAALMQAPLAVIAFLAGSAAGLLGASPAWFVAAALMGAVVVFTFVGIMPTNRKLLAPGRDPASDETHQLLRQWGVLHSVRTVLALTALVLMLWQLVRA
jgi:hypothetical protein